MMRTLTKITATLICLSSTEGFSRYRSSFTGRAEGVCSRAELYTELTTPPSCLNLNGVRRGATLLSMPPFLKKFGFGKPKNSILGGDSEEEDKPVVVLESSESLAASDSEEEDKPVVVLESSE